MRDNDVIMRSSRCRTAKLSLASEPGAPPGSRELPFALPSSVHSRVCFDSFLVDDLAVNNAEA